MIHRAQVLVRTPGRRWASDMQAKRTDLAKAISLVKPDSLAELIAAHLLCTQHDIAIKSIDGKLVDDGDLEYEFVTYAQRKIIIAVFISDDDVGSPIRFAELFPNMHHGEACDADRAFLIVPAARGFTKGWALQPTGRDKHNDMGFEASPSYLQKLLRAVR